MVDNFRHVINMANSIIGVSILSMPYCFREVGIILGIALLLICGYITKKTCMFLIRSAIMARRRSYELLAFQVFGVTGKLFMELCMILFLLGICISFHVVIGDLAPSIVAKYTLIENTSSLRGKLLIGIVLLIILPLCLLRNIDSLASLSACSIGFYVFLNIVIFYAALPKLLDASWIHTADLFHVEKSFKVLPIMLLAMACQSNVFEIYASIPDPDVHIMDSVVKHAINICCALYIGVGFLGYIAFHDKEIGGNIIMSFSSSNLTDGITMFFVISLIISFPLMLFPCRTSIHSLIYKRNVQLGIYDGIGSYMPEFRFKIITISTLVISLIIGIMIPNIEFVLGLLGSTMGMWIALLLPSVFFIRVYTKLSFDRLLAQGLLFLGVFLMIMGTYLHLINFRVQTESVTPITVAQTIKQGPEGLPIIEVPLKNPVQELSGIEPKVDPPGETARKEPAIPEPPGHQEEQIPLKQDNQIDEGILNKRDVIQNIAPPKSPPLKAEMNPHNEIPIKDKAPEVNHTDKQSSIVKKEVKEEDLHPDAIKKEEKEKAEEKQAKEENKDVMLEKKQEEVLKKLEEHQKEQVKILEAQKEILQELKDQKDKVDVVIEENKEIEEGGIVDERPSQDIQVKEHHDPVNRVEKRNFEILQNDIDKVVPPLVEDNLSKDIDGKLTKDVDSIPKYEAPDTERKIVVSPAQYVESKVLKDVNDVHQRPAGNLYVSKNPKINVPVVNIPKYYQPHNDPMAVPRNNGMVNQLAKHDEERKKRHVDEIIRPKSELNVERNKISDQASKENIGPMQSKNTLIESKNLNPPEFKINEDEPILSKDLPNEMVLSYDTRHLLWDNKKIRRRKKRNDQYPDYWEEM